MTGYDHGWNQIRDLQSSYFRAAIAGLHWTALGGLRVEVHQLVHLLRHFHTDRQPWFACFLDRERVIVCPRAGQEFRGELLSLLLAQPFI